MKVCGGSVSVSLMSSERTISIYRRRPSPVFGSCSAGGGHTRRSRPVRSGPVRSEVTCCGRSPAQQPGSTVIFRLLTTRPAGRQTTQTSRTRLLVTGLCRQLTTRPAGRQTTQTSRTRLLVTGLCRQLTTRPTGRQITQTLQTRLLVTPIGFWDRRGATSHTSAKGRARIGPGQRGWTAGAADDGSRRQHTARTNIELALYGLI